MRISIRTRNRDQNVNPQAVFKSFLTELSLHDPTAKIGANNKIFYTLETFPTDPKDFNDAFHGKAQEGEHPKIKPFYTEYVGNGPSICTWFTISSTLNLRSLHTKLNAWLLAKQVFIEPITNGYVGPRETVGYLTGISLNLTFRSTLIRNLNNLITSMEEQKEKDMDTSGPAQDTTTHLLPPRHISVIKTRLHINTKQHCHTQALTIIVPKGHGQTVTELLMSAHSHHLHHQIPGTFLVRGMINETNKNFVEEQILLQNKINLHATSLDIYKLSKTLLHQPYTPPTTDNKNNNNNNYDTS